MRSPQPGRRGHGDQRGNGDDEHFRRAHGPESGAADRAPYDRDEQELPPWTSFGQQEQAERGKRGRVGSNSKDLGLAPGASRKKSEYRVECQGENEKNNAEESHRIASRTKVQPLSRDTDPGEQQRLDREEHGEVRGRPIDGGV